VEDRLIPPRASRPGAASIALLLIILITAAWWALALWPVGELEPAWLARTRAACFGAVPGGLPDAGGWILLIGEPIGMLGVLLGVWGRELGRDLRRLGNDRRWRIAGAGMAVLILAGLAAAGSRVARATSPGPAQPMAVPGTPSRLDQDASTIVLTDQSGRRTPLAGLNGKRVLVSFAFGHCGTVCPTLVHDLLAARARRRHLTLPLVIVTLDPWRDTPERLPALAAQWGLGASDRILSGTIVEVEQSLDALGIARRRNETTGDIDHVGTVLLLDERGHIVWRVDGGWGRVDELLAAQ
jgi:cytochrome oxidase Cu insertion factor (SCO1/SenC/PrrC family)